MPRLLVFLLLSPTLAFAGPDADGPCDGSCAPAGTPQLVVTVRQDLSTPLRAPALARIARHVRALWEPHVDVHLTTFLDEAAGLPADDTLDLLITERRASRSGDGLGWIEFVDGRPARLITVSMTMARRLAAEGSWGGRPIGALPPVVRETFLLRAVARAIAHEIGHYLLRSKAHRAHGLMRDAFTVADIMNPAASARLFAAPDLMALQQRAASYLLARQAGPDGDRP